MCYLIDGYNALHVLLPGLINKRGLEEARREFLQLLAPHLKKLHPKKIVLVFDSSSFEGNSYAHSDQIRVIFAPPPSADEYIKRTIQGNNKYIVVSDDREIIDSAKMTGVSYRTNSVFFMSIGVLKAAKPIKKIPQKKSEENRLPPKKQTIEKDAEMFGMALDETFELKRKNKREK